LACPSRDDDGVAGTHPSVLLGIDYEDWDQLMGRRFGDPGWDRPSPALERQTGVLLDLLDEIAARATFFVLGVSARHHPGLVREIAARGHEIASHGYDHQPVTSHTPRSLADDLARSRDVIGEACGRSPAGYRAPCFSLARDARWALAVIRAAGFTYDSSLFDSPLVRGRLRPQGAAPYRHVLKDGQELWEVPLAVARWGPVRLPVAGSTYWRVLPPLTRRALLRRQWTHAPVCPLYFHPYDVDPERLEVPVAAGRPVAERGHARWQTWLHNVAPGRVPSALRELSDRVAFRTYGDAVSNSVVARSALDAA
jgi:polysaccharide deacetylase family protein (PEP-CTERM system associated)